MDFRILGPLEVVDAEGCRLDLGAPRQRAVLAVLLVHLNEVVSIDRLIDELWGQTPPNAATSSLQAYISNLRRVLEPHRAPRTPARVLVTEAPGYILRAAADDVDATRFEQFAADGRRALGRGDTTHALESFGAALGLWRGDALADFAYESFAASEVSRLEELRAAVAEDRVEAQLITGDLGAASAALRRLVPTYPLRERLRGLQIRALYASGRQAEALRAFEDIRRLLADELGLEPGRELQLLHRQVLAQDPILDSPAVPAAPAVTSRPAPDPAPSPPAARSMFVGRENALARLDAAVDDARAGRTRMLVVEGEPGIGKTRLAAEVAARAGDRGVASHWGRCHEDAAASPLWPWVQILRGLGVAGIDLPGYLRPVLATLLPELGPATDDDLVADAARFRLYDAVREAIERCAADRPSVVILDDLQWADASSLRLLRFLATELRAIPVLVVVTFRTTDDVFNTPLGEALADIARRHDADRLHLTGLSEPHVAELIRVTATIPEDQIGTVAATVHDRTNGNPFFVTELVRLMQSERSLGVASAGADVPVAVSDVIRRRIARLPDDAQTVLGVAAVMGREFDVDVLARACGLDPERTLEALEGALVTRILVQESAARYRFVHTLVSETLYADLAPSRRVRLHGRVADAIESTWHSDLTPHYSELAYHYGLAPTTASEQARKYASLAAEQALDRHAYHEVCLHWRAALAALDHTAEATPAARAQILLELAAAERCAGNLAAASEVHDDALAAAKRSNDRALLAEAALAYGEVGLWQVRRYGTVDERVVSAIRDALDRLPPGDSALRARLLTGLAVALYYREGDRELGQALSREAVAMARRMGDAGLLATSLVELIVMLDTVADPSDQLAAAAELATLEGADVSRETASAMGARLARVALANGDASTLQCSVDRLFRRAEATRHPDERLWATWARATVAFLHDRLEDAERLAGEAFALHQQLGIWGAQETYALHMVLVWREQGRLAAVSPLVEPLLEESVHPSAAKLRGIFALDRRCPEEIPDLLGADPVPRSRDFTWLADVCVTAELASAARLPCCTELYDMLLPFRDRIVTMDGTFICLGAAALYLGLLAVSLGRTDEAWRHLEHAVVRNDAVGAVPWSRRARAAFDASAAPRSRSAPTM